MIQDSEHERDVGAGADAHVLVGLGGRPREARIHDDHLRAGFLRMQHVQHRHRAANVHRALGVLHVVIGVGHRAVAPGVGYAGNRRRVADARLVVAVVRPPERHELAHQIRLFVVVLRAADPEHGVGTRFLADLQHLGADFVQRLLPRQPLPFAVDELHRRLQPVRMLDDAVLAYRCTLGAVRAQVDRRFEHGLLPRPHTILDSGVDRAADRAVRADGALLLHRLGIAFLGCHGRADGSVRQLARKRAGTRGQTRALQECPPVHRGHPAACEPLQPGTRRARNVRLAGKQHGAS